MYTRTSRFIVIPTVYHHRSIIIARFRRGAMTVRGNPVGVYPTTRPSIRNHRGFLSRAADRASRKSVCAPRPLGGARTVATRREVEKKKNEKKNITMPDGLVKRLTRAPVRCNFGRQLWCTIKIISADINYYSLVVGPAGRPAAAATAGKSQRTHNRALCIRVRTYKRYAFLSVKNKLYVFCNSFVDVADIRRQ